MFRLNIFVILFSSFSITITRKNLKDSLNISAVTIFSSVMGVRKIFIIPTDICPLGRNNIVARCSIFNAPIVSLTKPVQSTLKMCVKNVAARLLLALDISALNSTSGSRLRKISGVQNVFGAIIVKVVL